MKHERDVIARLGQLTESDRGWILSQLPAQLRGRLLTDEVPRSPVARLADQKAAGQCIDEETLDRLYRAEPALIAQALGNEPTYLVAAFVMMSDWPWRTQFLNRLTAAERSQIAMIAHTVGLAHEFSSALAGAIARRLENGVPEAARRPSRFEALVERIGAARSKKRLTRL